MEEQKDKVKKLIRPLLIAAKHGVPLEKVNREYREMIGEPIPYRKLGYSTLEEFLDQSPDLCRVSYSANGVILHGVATEATAHVAALVASQRSLKKRSKPVKAPSRRPFTRQWQPPTPSQSFRGGGGGNQFNRNQQGGNRPNRPGGSGRFPTIQNRSPQALAQYQQQQQQQQQRLRTPNYPAVGGMSRGGGRQPQTKPTLANQRPAYQHQPSNPQPKPNQGNGGANKPSNTNYVQQLTSYFDQNNVGGPTFKTAPMEMKVGNSNNKMNNKGKKMTKWVSTVQVGEQRFQTFPNSFNSKEQAEEAAAALAIAKLNLNTSQSANNNSVMAMPIGHFEDIQNEDAIESYVDRIFELVGNRTNGVWSTQIDVEYKKKYQKSLPDKWPSKIESSQEGSQKLRVDEPINGRYIICPIITESNEEIPESKPVNQQNNEKNVNSNNSNTTTKLEPKKSRPPKLKLPEDADWDVYITCVHSTMNVCLRILGDAYSGKFDDMVTSMELDYFESEEVPLDKNLLVTQPEVGGLYAAKVEGDWHRVEVTHVRGLEVTCFFIDHGDEDVLKVQNLRVLLAKFCVLAPQAKSVRLAGLEDLNSDPNAQAELTNFVLGKSLVGQVHLKDDSGISMILYDTSNSDEDVNINEKVLDKFAPKKTSNGVSSHSSPENTTPPPPLEAPKDHSDSLSDNSSDCSASGIKELSLLDLTKLEKVMPATLPEAGDFFDVNVTLAASPSNFTVQPWQNTTQLETFQSSLNAFYCKPQNAYGRTLTNADINSGDKFYAGQHMDGEWYRVKVNATIDENTVAAKIVDFGDFTMIPLENLQPLWPQFRKLPMQSVNASLADIVAANGDWTAEDTVWFSKRVVNCQFVSRIKDIIYDSLEENVRITVSLVDTTHPTTDIYIEKQLVEDKRAVYLCV